MNLSRRITLQTRAVSIDALGQESTAWTDTATVWADIKPLSARDFQAANQAQAGSTVRVHIRKRNSVLATMRIMWDGRAAELPGRFADGLLDAYRVYA